MHTAQINGKRPGGTGHGPNGRISPRLESPSSPCGWEQRHAAHGSRIPPPRTDQKTSSTKHTLPRISLKLGGQSGVPRGSQGSERLLGWVARPSNPLRRRQPMPTEGAGKVGLWLIFLQFVNDNTWLSPRFESEITCACIAPKDRVQIGHILRPHNPPETAYKEPESCARTARNVRTK